LILSGSVHSQGLHFGIISAVKSEIKQLSENHPPTILSLTATPSSVSTVTVSTITCSASDPNGDTLTYIWSATGGTISGSGLSINWTAPATTGTYTITCTVSDGKGGSDSKNVNITVNLYTSSSTISLYSVNDFVYQLQNIDLAAIGNTKFDLVIIDYSKDGSDEKRFTAEQINALKHSPGGPKIVLAYMSIGEAENYRWYWNNKWDADNDGNPDPGAPSWLGSSNPEWPGNYKVKYWESGWQSIIYGSSTSYIDKIIEAGFDGVYLDIIDAYEYWGPGGESGLNRETAEQELVDFVKNIANYAHVTKGKTNFLIFPQNGEGLSTHSDYLQAVNGIGKEDTWYNGNTPQPSSYTNKVIANLDVFKQVGKLVLVIDYVTQQNLIDDFYSKAIAKGYVPCATVRALDKLTINPGHEPD
jgi:cysteinyl-tRNA synthetase